MANRMLRLACTSLLLLSLLAVINTAVAAGEVSVVPSTLTVSPGGTFTVNINVDSGSSNLQAANITLNFNPNVLTANSITNKNLLGAGTLEVPGSGISPGKVKFGLARTAGNPAAPVNGAFITVQFTVNSSAPAGDYVLDLADVQLKNSTTADIPDVQVTDGQVTVTGQGTTSSSTSTTTSSSSSSSASPVSTPSTTAAQKPTGADNTAKSNQTSSATDQPAKNESRHATSGFEAVLLVAVLLLMGKGKA